MKKKKHGLIIPFSGLKEGHHQFDFDVNEKFFEQFEYSIIQNAEIHIEVALEKKSNLLNLEFQMNGQIHSNCDRCTEPVSIKVNGNEELIVKFGEESYEQTDEIKIIDNSAYELDVTDEVYEYIHLLLPNKIVHKKLADCNQEIIEKLEELSYKKEQEETDPRWAELEKLKKEANKNS
jgi:uncharacterized metal-binding protein YceD (DUF177 family)